MRRLAMALVLTGCMTVAGTGVALAQSSSPIPGAAPVAQGPQRVYPPGAGFAITFPADWDVDLETGEEGVELGASRTWVEAWFPSGAPADYGCIVDSIASDLALEAFVDDDLRAFDLDDPGRPAVTMIDLPAGTALRADDSSPVVEEYPHATTYYLERDGTVVVILCSGVSYPDDFWLSVVETFEFLPQPVTLEGGRVEIPSAMAALTFPDDWTIEVVRPETHPWLIADETSVSGYPGDSRLLARSVDERQQCLVLDFARVGDEVAPGISGMRLNDEIVQRRHPDRSNFHSEAPSSARDWQGAMDGIERGGTAFAMFSFTNADSWLVLDCYSAEPGTDVWRSIAETFEYVPAAADLISTGPVVIGGRIEAPSAGIAMEVPEGWYAFDLNHQDLLDRLGEVDQVTAEFALRGNALENKARLSETGTDMAMLTWPPVDGPIWLYRESCVVMIAEAQHDSMDEALADVQEMWDAAGIPHEVITLPVGEVVRSGSPEGAERVNSSFGLIHSGLAYSLLCSVPREALSGDVAEARERWLSIAETFEFLLVE